MQCQDTLYQFKDVKSKLAANLVVDQYFHIAVIFLSSLFMILGRYPYQNNELTLNKLTVNTRWCFQVQVQISPPHFPERSKILWDISVNMSFPLLSKQCKFCQGIM